MFWWHLKVFIASSLPIKYNPNSSDQFCLCFIFKLFKVFRHSCSPDFPPANYLPAPTGQLTFPLILLVFLLLLHSLLSLLPDLPPSMHLIVVISRSPSQLSILFITIFLGTFMSPNAPVLCWLWNRHFYTRTVYRDWILMYDCLMRYLHLNITEVPQTRHIKIIIFPKICFYSHIPFSVWSTLMDPVIPTKNMKVVLDSALTHHIQCKIL